jgi:hypothetical protein
MHQICYKKFRLVTNPVKFPQIIEHNNIEPKNTLNSQKKKRKTIPHLTIRQFCFINSITH